MPNETGAAVKVGVLSSRVREITDLHNAIVLRLSESLEMAIRLGGLLADVKADLPHGKFGAWVDEHMPFTRRSATNYMKLYRHRDELKRKLVSDLKTAYRLLADSRPAVDVVRFIQDKFLSDELVSNCEPGELLAGVVMFWCQLKKTGDQETIEKLLEAAREHYGRRATVTNNWHGDEITCHCPKCNGKTIDIRHLHRAA